MIGCIIQAQFGLINVVLNKNRTMGNFQKQQFYKMCDKENEKRYLQTEV
jgi:hypothetical protein